MTDYEKGLQKLREGKYQEAVAIFDKALAQYPDDATCMSDKAVALFHLHQKAEALVILDRAQHLEPSNPYRYSSRAFVKEAMGDLRGAIADYQKAIELDPEDMVAYNNLGLLEEKLGYKEAAKKKFEEADALAKKLGIEFDDSDNFVESKQRNTIPSATSGQMQEERVEEKTDLKEVIKEKSINTEIQNPENEANPTINNYLQIFKQVFTSKQGFQEFISFVFNANHKKR
jgi:Flp pilus assembly protein TadD